MRLRLAPQEVTFQLGSQKEAPAAHPKSQVWFSSFNKTVYDWWFQPIWNIFVSWLLRILNISQYWRKVSFQSPPTSSMIVLGASDCFFGFPNRHCLCPKTRASQCQLGQFHAQQISHWAAGDKLKMIMMPKTTNSANWGRWSHKTITLIPGIGSAWGLTKFLS